MLRVVKEVRKLINRICISINNKCNLRCKYCHFREKNNIANKEMNVFEILSNVKNYAKDRFKIGFVGNGEPLLDIDLLKTYVEFLSDNSYVNTYTITNGTVFLSDENWIFLKDHKVKVGFSLDGYKELHNKYRGCTFDRIMKNINNYKRIYGDYPTFNATVGKESLENSDSVISFFEKFGTRVTFSRMIGQYGISLDQYHDFLSKAETRLNVRRGGNDCTMYGGKCGAGINNFFFANGYVYLCGNCIDMKPIGPSSISFFDLENLSISFDRTKCYKEILCE